MKIIHLSNSFLVISVGDTRLACDPWIGKSSYGGWMSYPISTGSEEILNELNLTHLFISHIHADHVGGTNLIGKNMLCEVAKTNIPVFIKNFERKDLARRLASFGFVDIRELEAWAPTVISDDLEVTIIPCDQTNVEGIENSISYDIDTSIIIKSVADGALFFNKVDNPMSLSMHYKVNNFIKSEYSRDHFDVACMAVGAASEYPQCFLNIDRAAAKSTVIRKSLTRFEQQLSALKSDYFFPAGGNYFIPGKYSILNRFIAAPSVSQLDQVVSNVTTYKASLGNIQSIEKTGHSWQEVATSWPAHESIEQAIAEYRSYKYEYNAIQVQDYNAVSTLFDEARTRYFAKLDDLEVIPIWQVDFLLYEDLHLNSDGLLTYESKPIATFTLKGNTETNTKYRLVCHLDYQLFVGLLQGICNWNITLSGSLIMYERIPDIFVPAIPFSLNFLTAKK